MFWSHFAHPDRWRHKSDPPALFEHSGSFTSPSNRSTRMKETRANGLMSPPNDAIIWSEKGVSQLSWSHQFTKHLGWWSGQALNSRPPSQQTGALATELTGGRLWLVLVTEFNYKISKSGVIRCDIILNGRYCAHFGWDSSPLLEDNRFPLSSKIRVKKTTQSWKIHPLLYYRSCCAY